LKASLSGYTDTYNRKITYHHNRFENIESRLPLVRGGQAHVFNNYYKGINSTALNEPAMSAGKHSVAYTNAALRPGIYFCEVKTATRTLTRKLVVE
jgi:pectate lyase